MVGSFFSCFLVHFALSCCYENESVGWLVGCVKNTGWDHTVADTLNQSEQICVQVRGVLNHIPQQSEFL